MVNYRGNYTHRDVQTLDPEVGGGEESGELVQELPASLLVSIHEQEDARREPVEASVRVLQDLCRKADEQSDCKTYKPSCSVGDRVYVVWRCSSSAVAVASRDRTS